MCLKCVLATSEKLIVETGISPAAMEMIDMLLMQSVAYGRAGLEAEQAGDEPISGDPLEDVKTTLVRHVANLEQFTSYIADVDAALEDDEETDELPRPLDKAPPVYFIARMDHNLN
jgi:hypothetical protein